MGKKRLYSLGQRLKLIYTTPHPHQHTHIAAMFNLKPKRCTLQQYVNQCFIKAYELLCRKMQITIKHITNRFNPALFSIQQLTNPALARGGRTELGEASFISFLPVETAESPNHFTSPPQGTDKFPPTAIFWVGF